MAYDDDCQHDCPHGTLPAKLGILEGVQACLDAMIGLGEIQVPGGSSALQKKLEKLEETYWDLYKQYDE